MLRSKKPLTLKNLFNTIDAMPMRKEEAKHQQNAGVL